MVLIYTPKITQRKKYIFKLLLGELLGFLYTITENIEEYKAFVGVKINYSNQPSEDEIFIYSHSLLNETDIKIQDFNIATYEGVKVLFSVFHEKSDLPFDIFAASFYLVSRYEEYLPFMKDDYGRFDAKQSLAFHENFLHRPVVNIWANYFISLIKKKIDYTIPIKRNFSFIPTIDIDSAYAYKNKGFSRTIGGYIKNIIALDFHEMQERTLAVMGMKKDLFDTFEYQFALQKKYHLKPIYFVLFAEYGALDKNISTNNNKFINLVKYLSDYAEVGIHPSFASNTDTKLLKSETSKLSSVLNKEITKSRQHFLKLSFPNTYRNLIANDISDDYTMGYACEPGFRAGICDSFLFFDLELDKETNLRIHPFVLMEGTLRDYKNIEANQAFKLINSLIDEVKNVNGTFITLWHNESYSNQKRWIGWNEVYENMVRYALGIE